MTLHIHGVHDYDNDNDDDNDDNDDDEKFAPIQVQFRTAQVTGMWVGLDSGHGDNVDRDDDDDYMDYD